MLRITKTENGMVKGLPGTDARITVFKGIPFAADTSGENRWRPPQPVENWEGIRNCFQFSPITMQGVPGKNPEAFYAREWHVDNQVPISEDSLTLNIWTNAKTGDEKMPVYVWIFGGGLHEGYSYEMEFDGERIASRGVVVVSIAYRVNIFGYLCHPELTAENPDAPANFGFLDQQAALKWVQRNIQNFGGDPGNVTIGGQSAGGISVWNHLCAPSSADLFHKAIIQSAAGALLAPYYPKPPISFNNDLKVNEEYGAKFLKEVLGVDTIAEARKLPGTFIRDKVEESRGRFPNVVDGKFFCMPGNEYLYKGLVPNKPVIMGYTGDEAAVGPTGNTWEEIEAEAKKFYDSYADQAVKLWKETAGDDIEAVKKVAASNSNQLVCRYMGPELARQGTKFYCYNFDPDMPGDDAGAFHSSDLWFTFETLMKCWRPFDGHHYDLARKMCNYWTNFMKTGDPNGPDADGTPMPEWKPYSAEDRNLMQFFDEITPVKDEINAVDTWLTDLNESLHKNF